MFCPRFVPQIVTYDSPTTNLVMFARLWRLADLAYGAMPQTERSDDLRAAIYERKRDFMSMCHGWCGETGITNVCAVFDMPNTK
jgi:hypothetical protein